LTPDQWWKRAEADRHNPELWFRGQAYSYDELVRARDQDFAKELGAEKFQARHAACHAALDALGDVFARIKPDVAVIVGDDQHECFLDDNMPAVSVFWGEAIENAGIGEYPTGGERTNPGLREAALGHMPPLRATYAGEPSLGRHMIERLMGEDFDLAHSRKLPMGEDRFGGIGHAFGFVYRRIMRDEVVPNVPIMLNTYFPPNQPSPKRCYNLGRAVCRAIESWDSDKRVAVIASGGLTHFVIEEDLDREIIAGMKEKSEKRLTSLPTNWFNSGTSEIRNWITVAGMLEGTNLDMNLVDYVPCYRSEAGTGCAMTFATWT
jgi:hypothetical protein